ncbi:hypothetical protein HN011_002096 [Eciton burchellii]|nr:hypothetical protein HN011_002096 [Eciton burchellii]
MDDDERDRAESLENGGRFKDGHVEEVVDDPARSEAGDASSSNSIIILNEESRCLDGTSVLQPTSRVTVWPRSLADSPPISRNRVLPEVALKLHDLPILRPPEAFRVPVFRCRTPSLSWQHCECLSHTHLPPRRSSISRSAFERFSTIPMYRTWPNRAARRFGRPSRRTVGTQSSLDGARSSLGVLRCVVRSIDMTERSLDQEIGVSIPF